VAKVQDPCSNVKDPYNIDEYNGNQDVFRAVSQGMMPAPILWVEGSSDRDALKHFMNPTKHPLDIYPVRRLQDCHLGKRDTVIEYHRLYNPEKDKGEEFFSIDRDMDNMTEEDLVDDSEHRLFYQMCEDGRQKGYNDLECFLYSSPLLRDVITQAYGIEARYVDNVRQQIEYAASFLGTLRIGSRMVRGNSGKYVLNYPTCSPDSFMGGRAEGKYPRYGEIDARFLFEKGLAVTHDGVIKIDRDRVYQEIRNSCVRSAPDDVEKALEIASELQTDIIEHGHKIDFCRGHDLTYFLAKLLNGIKGCPAPKTCHDLEDQIGLWDITSEDTKKKFRKSLMKVELFRTFMR